MTAASRAAAARVLPLLAWIALAGPAISTAGDDFQLWTEAGVEAPAGTLFRLGVHEEVRFLDGARQFALHGSSAGIACGWTDRLMLSLEFREELVRIGRRFLAESRPYVGVTWATAARGFDLSTRNRFEARLRDRREDVFRYRNRVQVIAPSPFAARPFFSEEIFVEGSGEGFTQNRLASGLTAPWGPLSAAAYYMLVSIERGGWAHAHALGVNLSWSFRGRPMMSGER